MTDGLALHQQLVAPPPSLEPLFDFKWFFGKLWPLPQAQQSPSICEPLVEAVQEHSGDLSSEESNSPSVVSPKSSTTTSSGSLQTNLSSLSVLDDELNSEIEELKRSFDIFDENKDGKLSSEELRRVLGKLGLDLTEQDLQAMMMAVDKNGNGFVDLDEFVTLYIKQDLSNQEEQETEDDLKEAFEIFDENKDGFISAQELQHMMSNFGIEEGTDEVDCMRMIRGVDRDGDELVNFREFKELMCTKTQQLL